MDDEQGVGGNTQREPSFGEKAVGLNFNPSSNPEVDTVKRGYADVIDQLNTKRDEIKAGEDDGQNAERLRLRLLSIAITEAQAAQMWAV
jgi:hypothetical protein